MAANPHFKQWTKRELNLYNPQNSRGDKVEYLQLLLKPMFIFIFSQGCKMNSIGRYKIGSFFLVEIKC